MGSDKDDDDWLKLADAIADMEIDTKIEPTSKVKRSSLDFISEEDEKGIEAIWKAHMSGHEESAEAVEDVSEHEEQSALFRINSLINTEKFTESFIYDQPGSVTVKGDDGTFAKKKVFGGEKFSIKRVYKGRKSTIFVFNVQGWKGKTAELSKLEASKYLTGFDSWHDRLMNEHNDRVLTDAKKLAVVLEKEASERYEAQGDKNFGSW
jgi:hypothetical protein